MADYYELLGVPRTATRRRDQEGVPQAGARAAPRRQPRRPRRRGAVQAGGAGVRGAERPRAARPLRPVRRGRASAAAAGRTSATCSAAAGSATSSTRSSAAAARSVAAVARPGRARRVARTSRSSADITFEQAVFGATVPVTVRTAVACDDCGGIGRRRGHQARHVRRVQRCAARCAACARACSARWSPPSAVPAVRRPRRRSSSRPCPTCSGEGRIIGREDLPGRRARRASTPARRCGSPGAVRSGPRGGGAGDLYVHLRVAPHDRFRRDGDDLVTELPVSIAQAALGTKFTLRDARRRRGDRRARRHAARPRVRAARPRACRACRAGVVAICGSIVRVEVPTKLSDGGGRAAAAVRRVARRGGRRRAAGCSRGSSRRSRERAACRRCCGAPRRTSSSTTSTAPVLDDDDAHHLFRVLRLRDGELGHGQRRRRGVAAVPVRAAARSSRRRRRVVAQPAPPITIAFAIPKGDRPEWIVQKLTELGVDRIVVAARRPPRGAVGRANGRRSNWRGCAASPARPHAEPRGCGCRSIEGPVDARRRCSAGVGGSPSPAARALAIAAIARVAIGPEGGCRRRGARRAAAERASLGDTVLRVETAAIVAACVRAARRLDTRTCERRS